MNKPSFEKHLGSVSSRVVAALIMILLVAVAVAAYDHGSPPDPTPQGLWVSTSYAASLTNTCDVAAGEICKEWCRMEGTTPVGTGELCCAVYQTCRSPR